MATATALYTRSEPQASALSRLGSSVISLSKTRVRALENEPLLERCEALFEACMASQDANESGWLRQQLDMANAEAARRKLICWQL